MTQEEILEVVKTTINELEKRNLIKHNDYPTVLRSVEVNLYNYFEKRDKCVEDALKTLYNDPYIKIIYYCYRDNLTIEKVAEYMNKDVSTIKRNKKRLIIKIYNLINEM